MALGTISEMLFAVLPINRHFTLICTISLRFRYFSQIQIWTLAIIKLLVSYANGYQQFNYPISLVSNLVMQSISVIVFILVFNAGHSRFTCHQCPNLNLREISESESDALRIHFTLMAFSPVCPLISSTPAII